MSQLQDIRVRFAGRWPNVNQWPCHPQGFAAMLCLIALVSGCSSQATPKVPRLWKPGPDQWYSVLVTGRDFSWHIRYPGPDRILRTDDDILARRHLHLPAYTKVRVLLASDDYVYSLALPHWDVKQIAVPDLSFSLEFETTEVGQFDLMGNQMCGYTHPNLLGQARVQSHVDFDDWLRKQTREREQTDSTKLSVD